MLYTVSVSKGFDTTQDFFPRLRGVFGFSGHYPDPETYPQPNNPNKRLIGLL